MKSIFDRSTREELISRIASLNENSKAQWGKMTIYQMLKHCTLWEEMISGRERHKRVLLGRLFGRMALKDLIKDEKPMMRNAPTIPALRISGNGSVSDEKTKWIIFIEQYEHFSNPGIVHPFFGRMEKEQIGYLAYKHTDHHLRQFNC